MVSPIDYSTPLRFGRSTRSGEKYSGVEKWEPAGCRPVFPGVGVRACACACVFACVRVLCSLVRLNAFILPVMCWLD